MKHSQQGNPQPNRGKSEIVLGSCLVEGDVSAASAAEHSRREAFGISLAIEVLILGLLVAAPLFSSIAQPQFRPMLPTQLTFFHPGPRTKVGDRAAAQTITRRPQIADPYQQILLVRTVANAPSQEITRDPVGEGMEPYIPGTEAMPIGQVTQLINESPKVPRPVQQEKHPVKLSEGVLQAQLLNRIEPRYPSIAVQTKTEGTVVLHAFISRDGRITSLEVISGNPLLIHAALEAVQQWRYRPTMLSGEPVEVETTITVAFRLHN
jgi:protein TonB